MSTQPRTCTDRISAAEGEYSAICFLPAGHAGEHDHVDTMGMCIIDDDCRAAHTGGPIDWNASRPAEHAAIPHTHSPVMELLFKVNQRVADELGTAAEPMVATGATFQSGDALWIHVQTSYYTSWVTDPDSDGEVYASDLGQLSRITGL